MPEVWLTHVYARACRGKFCPVHRRLIRTGRHKVRSTPLGMTEYRRACTITRRLRSSTLPPFAKGAKDGAPRVRGAVGGVQRTDLRYPCRAPTDAGSLDFTRASPSGRSFSTRG